MCGGKRGRTGTVNNGTALDIVVEVRMDRIKNLESEYEHWEHLYKYGGSDPFYADGVNLNLLSTKR